MGRDVKMSHIYFSDISVSRIHAKIFMVSGDYYIEDNKSKFGTLIRKEKMKINL